MVMKEATKQKRLAELNEKITDIKNKMDEDWRKNEEITDSDGSNYVTAEEWAAAKLTANHNSKINVEKLCKKWETAIEKRDKFVVEHMTEKNEIY